jgi:type III secretory pathway component EscR
MLDMPPPSDALKRAIKRYKSTDQGKQKQQEAFERWVENNPDAYRDYVKKAQEKYEQKPERKAAKAEWMREYRQRKKLEKQQAAPDKQE